MFKESDCPHEFARQFRFECGNPPSDWRGKIAPLFGGRRRQGNGRVIRSPRVFFEEMSEGFEEIE